MDLDAKLAFEIFACGVNYGQLTMDEERESETGQMLLIVIL